MIRPEQRFLKKPLSTLLCLSSSLLLLVAVAAFSQDPQDRDDVVRVETDLVVLNVTVTDGQGRYIHGLGRKDFKIYEDGSEQTLETIASFDDEETPFAAVVLLDTSGSMESRLALARSAAIRFLAGLRTEDVAAVYRFDFKTEQIQEFSSSRDLSPIAFDIRAKGMTALNDSIVLAAQDLAKRPEKRRAIVVLSDGADNQSKASLGKALESALAVGATIYTVDMSATDGNLSRNSQSAAALRELASKSGGRFIATPGGQAMRDAFTEIVAELGNQYTISYRPLNRARDGRWRTIEIKVSRPEVTARTRKGYRTPKK
jgi:Ca-activated chloride channel family protein